MDARDHAPNPALKGADPRAPTATDAVDFEHQPDDVLSVLEPDQLFAAKQHARFGRAQLSTGTRILMWGLRAYVIAMFLMVAMQVVHTFHGGR